jgi:hypothetical protein
MKKSDKPKKAQKSQGRVSRQPKAVTVLTDQDLEQVQGGQGLNSPDYIYQKIKFDS